MFSMVYAVPKSATATAASLHARTVGVAPPAEVVETMRLAGFDDSQILAALGEVVPSEDAAETCTAAMSVAEQNAAAQRTLDTHWLTSLAATAPRMFMDMTSMALTPARPAGGRAPDGVSAAGGSVTKPPPAPAPGPSTTAAADSGLYIPRPLAGGFTRATARAAIDELLQHAEASGQAAGATTCLLTLQTLMKRLQESPADEGNRKVKPTNAAIRARILEVPGGPTLMTALGWTESVEPAGAPDPRLLRWLHSAPAVPVETILRDLVADLGFVVEMLRMGSFRVVWE
jgi:hypothetical protein